jgi:NAD(P)-dependent dehydrogenase (short-subunit alcohol dehydrogenase family)
MLSKNMANEFIPDNIRVNVVNAGLVLTPDWLNTATKLTQGTATTPQQYLDRIAEEHAPIKRFASPEEIANLFVFLCSPRASYIVGSTCYIDGGMLKVIT